MRKWTPSRGQNVANGWAESSPRTPRRKWPCGVSCLPSATGTGFMSPACLVDQNGLLRPATLVHPVREQARAYTSGRRRRSGCARTRRIQRHVPFFNTSRDAQKYERLKAGLALYRLVFGQVNQEDLLKNLQRQVEEITEEERDKVLRRLASYMLNLSPIRQEQAIRFAQEEADELLAAYPASGGIERLLQGVARIRTERAVELSVDRGESSAQAATDRLASSSPASATPDSE